MSHLRNALSTHPNRALLTWPWALLRIAALGLGLVLLLALFALTSCQHGPDHPRPRPFAVTTLAGRAERTP